MWAKALQFLIPGQKVTLVSPVEICGRRHIQEWKVPSTKGLGSHLHTCLGWFIHRALNFVAVTSWIRQTLWKLTWRLNLWTQTSGLSSDFQVKNIPKADQIPWKKILNVTLINTDNKRVLLKKSTQKSHSEVVDKNMEPRGGCIVWGCRVSFKEY